MCSDEGKKASVKLDEIVIYWERCASCEISMRLEMVDVFLFTADNTVMTGRARL